MQINPRRATRVRSWRPHRPSSGRSRTAALGPSDAFGARFGRVGRGGLFPYRERRERADTGSPATDRSEAVNYGIRARRMLLFPPRPVPAFGPCGSLPNPQGDLARKQSQFQWIEIFFLTTAASCSTSVRMAVFCPWISCPRAVFEAGVRLTDAPASRRRAGPGGPVVAGMETAPQGAEKARFGDESGAPFGGAPSSSTAATSRRGQGASRPEMLL